MKNRLHLLTVFFFLSSFSIFAQDVLTPSGSSTIIFIRDTGFHGSLTPINAFIDDEIVCRLNNECYSIHEIDPGEHTFWVTFMTTKPGALADRVEINTKPGKTYYIQSALKVAILAPALYCKEAMPEDAEQAMMDLKEDLKCD